MGKIFPAPDVEVILSLLLAEVVNESSSVAHYSVRGQHAHQLIHSHEN